MQKDITHEFVTVVAVFGLVVSSMVATVGVTVLGIDAQVALAQYEGPAVQTAAAMLGDNRQDHPMAVMQEGGDRAASSTMPRIVSKDIASSSAMYCPKISKILARGGKDASNGQDIKELQRFIADRYHLQASSTVTGYFGSTTEKFVRQFQQEQGIPPAASVGKLTQAAIIKLCGHEGNTVPQPPRHEGDRSLTTPPPLPPPHSSQEATSSNGAAAIEALGEIGDGVSKLVGAYFSLFGL